MALINDDEDLMEDLIETEDYNVIPRPQELIELQKRSSSSKQKHTTEKSGFGTSKKSSESKQETKSREKKSSSKHERKGSKSKSIYKSRQSGFSVKKYLANELDSRFDSFVQNAKTHKHKLESSKITINEPSNLAGSKNKSSDLDANKFLDTQHSKIMDEPAVTPLDRFKVLDSRDTAFRSKDTKESGSKKTKIIGTCPDMCPEKERYSRIAKNCLSVLEMTMALDQNATSRDANHSYMVKEYSRSSADQQEPLPHELRPIPVLMFTMDYLLCNIMDLPFENISLADWYDFIWNRTRSIRKDITQQQLCDINSVEIIEKCVRFHIHCAEALSEEETATFDPKINNENLTKCLQTLKHMYHDLQSKGIQCPNEAEFRSYDILLSLTEGETLRLIKDIRKDLLKSPLIKFAFNAALAFKSHNYVKFFKLIENANYLSSCILHRYMLEARVWALQIIVRAYSFQQYSSSYPTASLVKDLKFENSAEASEFCRCHGLEADDTNITIERKQFCTSASALSISRSFLLVESKRGESLGKIINKGELPANPLNWYQPHESFDERNMLKADSLSSITKVDVSAPNVLNKPLTPTSTSAFHNLSSKPKKLLSTPISFVPPANLKFSYSEISDPITDHTKEYPLPHSHSTFNKKTLELPSAEDILSLGKKTSPQANFFRKAFEFHETKESSNRKISVPSETEIEYPEVETETEIIIEDISESSNEAIMEEAEESSQSTFNRNILEFNQSEENLGSLPINEILSSHPTFGKSTLQFPSTKKILSPRERPRISLQTEKEIEESDKLSVIDFVEDSEISSQGIELKLLVMNEESQENELNEVMEHMMEKLFSECVLEYSILICEEVMNDERIRITKLKEELEIRRTNLVLKTILKWRHFCERKRQRRMFENSTLCSPWQAMLLNTPCAPTGVVSPIVVYKKHCSNSRITAEKIKKRKEITPGWEEFKAEDIWPLKAFRSYPSAYFGKSGIRFYFKLCIVFPSDCVNSDVATFMNWICAKFSLHKTQDFKFDAKNTIVLHNGRMLVSVRALQLGSQTKSNYVTFLNGITAMILFVPPSSESNDFYDDFTSLLDSDTLQNPYPLFLYFLKSHQKSRRLISFLIEKLDARYFTELETACLPEIKHFKENSKKVLESLAWLLEVERKDFSHPWLHKSSFIHYVEDSFTFAFNIILCKISLDEFKCLKQMPQHIINFYNKVLKFRSSILCSDLLGRVHSSWPPEEIKLNLDNMFINIEIQKKYKEKMECLLLPNLEEESLNSYNIWDYVKCVGSFVCKDRDVLFMRVRNALENSISSYDWLTVINMCALHLIYAQNSALSPSVIDFPVYYTKEDVETFDCDEFWMEVSADIRSFSNLYCTKRKNDTTLDSPVKRKKWEWTIKEVTPPVLAPLEEKSFISSAFDMPDILSCQRESLFAPLRTALAKQFEQSEAFIHRLNESVQSIVVPTVTPEEDEFQDAAIFKDKMSSLVVNTDSFQSRLNSSNQLNSGMDFLGFSISDSSKSSASSLANKISELKYNIQKSNILEDHFSQLLSKQM